MLVGFIKASIGKATDSWVRRAPYFSIATLEAER